MNPLGDKRDLSTIRDESSLDLAGTLPSYSSTPKKFGIPLNSDVSFEKLRADIIHCIESMGISNTKTPVELLILALEANQGILRPGFLGSQRLKFSEKLSHLFGDEDAGWSFEHKIQKRLLTPFFAYQLMQDAYQVFFQKNPAILNNLIEQYSDVYDNAPSNIQSGGQYFNQEVLEKGLHIHDIAIRKAVHSLGKEFQGNRLLEVRGPKSEGFYLSPGEIEFHRPQLIPAEPFNGRKWWKDGTIEDFYQRTKTLVVNEFRDDSALPSNPQNVQKKSAYLHRIASRMLLRTIPMFQQETVNLSQLNTLPWMVDPNSFPIGSDGLARELAPQEICTVLWSINKQLEILFKQGKAHEYKLGNWTNFSSSSDFLKAVENKLLEGREKKQIRGDYQEIVELGAWEKVLPHFWSYINESNLRPLFLARDGLGVMEYISYRRDLLGKERHDPYTTVHRAIYLPGNLESRSAKNQRAKWPIIEDMVVRLHGFAQNAYTISELKAPPSNMEESKKLQEIYTGLITEYFDNCKTNNVQTYEWWRDVYSSILTNFKENLKDVVVIDTDGTGKSVLFIKILLEYFTNEDANKSDIKALIGGVQKKHLGIDNIVQLNMTENDEQTNSWHSNALPDIRWPFKFKGFDCEPIFNVTQNPAKIMGLFYRSLFFYNCAVRDASSQ